MWVGHKQQGGGGGAGVSCNKNENFTHVQTLLQKQIQTGFLFRGL